MIDIGGGLRVHEETRCRDCGAGTDSLRYYQGWLGFQAIECKVCGHQKDLNLDHGQSDTFFTQSSCDRCGGSLEKGRTMSWFTPECLCNDCHGEERKLRHQLRVTGHDDLKMEGCGNIPVIA
ncbi:MAG: hypothetical protein FPO08_00355 [Geobacter sp.]|nr:MAG: hypothetical protein FPO08_00355 [Geobacter sp.]